MSRKKFKKLLFSNIPTLILFISSGIVFFLAPKNAEGIGYLSIWLTGIFFIILGLTAFISSLREFLDR